MIEKLLPYIDFCPEKIRARFCNGADRNNEVWWREKAEEYIFCGLLFKNNRVYVINIYLFDKSNNYSESYLDITNFFKEHLKVFNIYHLCLIISNMLSNYYRESTLAEKILPYIKYHKDYQLPKIQYAVKKHHNRHQKFIIDSKNRSNELWNQILHKALFKIENLQSFANQRNERPDSLLFDYRTEPRIHICKHSSKPPNDIPPKRKRKARRRFGAFNPQSW